MLNQVLQGDCLELMKAIPDKSVDAVITDPPYGIGVSHWDFVIDIPAFTAEVKRISKGFYCFFGQMPTVVNWINEANHQKMKYREHIVWVKRACFATNPNALSKGHEDIFIYGKAPFCQTTGPYSDVKIPGILFDIATIQSLQRITTALITWVKTGETPTAHNFSDTQNKLYSHTRRFARYGNRTEYYIKDCNFTNVWSFLPPHRQSGRAGKGIHYHPTEKPIEVMKRLIEMLVPEGGTVLDPFAGSGTTGVAAINTNRNYILMEKEEAYIKLINERISNHVIQRSLF